MQEIGPTHARKSKYFVFTVEYLLPVFTIGFIIFLFWLFLYSKFFAITKVECELDYEPCSNQNILFELDKLKGENIFRYQDGEIIAKLTAGDYTVRSASSVKILPQTLKFDLQSVYPVVAIRLKGVENEWVVLDHKYRVISLKNTHPNCPVLLVDSLPAIRPGAPVSEELTRPLDMTIRLFQDIPSANSLELTDQTITLSLDSSQKALLTTNKDIDVQIQSLQAVLSDPTIISESRTIDVRFAHPVIESK